MKVGLSGPTYLLEPGDEREFPDAEAIRLIKADYAEPVSAQQIETAIKPHTYEKRGRKDRKGRGSGEAA